MTRVLLACVMIIAATICSAQSANVPNGVPVDLQLGTPGVRLEVRVRYGTDLRRGGAPLKQLAVVTAGRDAPLNNLNDLRGKLTVSDRATALRLVRLRTSYSTWMLWPSGHFELEVVRGSEIGTVPNYGLRDSLRPTGKPTGFLAAIQDGQFARYGFSPAAVTEAENGYYVTRWELVAENGTLPRDQHIERVREYVGHDGEYKRTVLKQLGPAAFPGIDWAFAGFSW